jgi:hypothetical protein
MINIINIILIQQFKEKTCDAMVKKSFFNLMVQGSILFPIGFANKQNG